MENLSFELFGLLVAGIVWGGFGYFLYRAVKAEKLKNADE